MDLLGLMGTVVVAFATTNIEDLFVLALFFANPAFHPRHVVAGQYLGIGALVILSVLGYLVALLIPEGWVRFLGVVPILVGLKQLLVPDTTGALAPAAVEAAGGGARLVSGKTLAVAGVTFANGGDNIGVYVPLFARLDRREVAAAGAVFLVLVGVWCAIAVQLVRHPLLGAPIRRYGYRIAPFVLIALGLGILLVG